MSQEHLDLIRLAFDGWNRGDLDAWLRPVHPDIEFVSEVASRVEGTETAYRGMAEMRRFWADYHAIWDMTIEITELRDLGDTVVALGAIHVRSESSGVALDSPIGYVFHFDAGLIRRARTYLSQADALAAVGLQA